MGGKASFADALTATQPKGGTPPKVPIVLGYMAEGDRTQLEAALRDHSIKAGHLARAINAHLRAIGVDDSISEGAVTNWRRKPQ